MAQNLKAWLSGLSGPELEQFARDHPMAAVNKALAAWEDPSTRMAAASLAGAAMSDPQGFWSRRASLDQTLAHFLKGQGEPGSRFAQKASAMIGSRRDALIPLLDFDALCRLDQELPGTASGSSPKLWGKAPKWCAKMRKEKRLNRQRLFECVAAGLQTDSDAIVLLNGDPRKQEAARFALRAEEEDPGWGEAVWSAYFALDVNPSDKGMKSKAQEWAWKLAHYGKFASSVNPFDWVGELNPKKAWLLDKVAWLMEDNEAMARQLGDFLATAPEEFIPSRAKAGDKPWLVVEVEHQKVGRLVAQNASAKALCSLAWLEEGRVVSPMADEGPAAQGRAWLGLAEGLARAGAPSPEFEFQWAHAPKSAHPWEETQWSGQGALRGGALALLALSDVQPGADASALIAWALSGPGEVDDLMKVARAAKALAKGGREREKALGLERLASRAALEKEAAPGASARSPRL